MIPLDPNDPIARSDDEVQRPAVTLDQYDAARAVLDALPPGFYAKCVECAGWYRGGHFSVKSLTYNGERISMPVCQGCKERGHG